LVCFGLALMVGMLFSGVVFGVLPEGTKRTVKAGEELELDGAILTRSGETFVLREITKTDTVVLLTDTTKIKTARKGVFRGGKDFDVTALIQGLVCHVHGIGNSEGQLMASEITFKDTDLKAAITAKAQTDEINDKANKALKDAADADKRISDLDDFEVVKVVTVYFAVNKAELSAESKASLDELAAKAPGAKNYTVEVQGFTDSTGNADKNLELSRKRADAVVQYLAVKHNIPLRRITTPMGYGSAKAVADDKTKEGRERNRRVEVRVLVNKGLVNKEGAKP
jgi:outer membrane protein OmpA-like peptidoglycan-associated protein